MPLCGGRERESNLEKAAEEICSYGRLLFVCFFAALQDGGLLEISCFFINGVVDGTSGECFLTITFRISSVKYRVYFLVVYLFIPCSRIDSQKKIVRETSKINVMP